MAMMKNMGVSLFVLALLFTYSGANAARVVPAVQLDADSSSSSPANPGEGLACLGPILSLIPCVDFLLGSSSNPSPACCIDLTIFTDLSPQCICLLTDGGISNYGLNLPKAKDLPKACNIDAPKCN
ncbi:hypothetical protein H6P81_003970 [Aristolochia fimbriata]|uniref:Bifunctional inhibitor/plant lipid transfer protein/seed storage helical domain-containing protein n=1 Tax=Aristolochia fimbriata TaxID=158543 RepID=A0AAV7FGZ6_ARIFI|nr:hypothetical protein H6P81_003970 [Aristolochia fimbriata]